MPLGKKKPKVIAKKQYIFRTDRVEQKKKEGWKVVNEIENRKYPHLKDLVLMEK